LYWLANIAADIVYSFIDFWTFFQIHYYSEQWHDLLELGRIGRFFYYIFYSFFVFVALAAIMRSVVGLAPRELFNIQM